LYSISFGGKVNIFNQVYLIYGPRGSIIKWRFGVRGMAEEMTDKSIVVWHPNLVYAVPDVSEWTSICLFHDQVVLCSPFLRTETESNPFLVCFETRSDSKEMFALIDKIQLLTKHKIIRLITPEEFNQQVVMDLHKVREPCIPHGLVKRFSQFVDQNLKGTKVEQDTALEALDLCGAMMSCLTSEAYLYPLVTSDINLQDHPNTQPIETLSDILARSAICQFALPDVRAVHVEDLLEVRNELKDQLLEFRVGILKLTWLLHQQIKNKNDLKQIRQEADALTDTVIKGSLVSLENRMRQHKNKRIKRMLFGTGKVLVEAAKLFLPGGVTEKMIATGKSFLQMATELDSVKPPEDQVAAYLYKLKGKLKAK